MYHIDDFDTVYNCRQYIPKTNHCRLQRVCVYDHPLPGSVLMPIKKNYKPHSSYQDHLHEITRCDCCTPTSPSLTVDIDTLAPEFVLVNQAQPSIDVRQGGRRKVYSGDPHLSHAMICPLLHEIKHLVSAAMWSKYN